MCEVVLETLCALKYFANLLTLLRARFLILSQSALALQGQLESSTSLRSPWAHAPCQFNYHLYVPIGIRLHKLVEIASMVIIRRTPGEMVRSEKSPSHPWFVTISLASSAGLCIDRLSPSTNERLRIRSKGNPEGPELKIH